MKRLEYTTLESSNNCFYDQAKDLYKELLRSVPSRTTYLLGEMMKNEEITHRLIEEIYREEEIIWKT